MIGGFFNNARAMATRCFSPPLSLKPRSPTRVLYPKGWRLTKSSNWACSAAAVTSSVVATSPVPSLPKPMLYSMVSLNKTQSCGTMPMCNRTLRCVHRLMS
mmetsp:Transcript_3137/g.12060  ORF Transcript_3137/g.12060 Transcript_3137/m.12060 type:complete len:101 (+) Transcript_3137:346-648(+)